MSINKSLTFIALLLFAFNAQAQFAGGAKLGGNLNSFGETSNAFGYLGGGFATYEISDLLSVGGEVLYVSTAGKLDSYSRDFSNISPTIESATYSNRVLRFNSIEIPVYARISLPVMESLSPKVYAGASYAYVFGVFHNSDNSYRIKGENNSVIVRDFENTSENVSSDFSQYNTTLTGGIQFNVDFGMPVTIDVRYQHGIPNLNIFNTTGKYAVGDFKSKTLSISFGVKLFGGDAGSTSSTTTN